MSPRVRLAVRAALLTLTGVALYILWPSLLAVFNRWPSLLSLNPAWFAVMLLVEGASFVCMWGLLRLALRTRRWSLVASSQLAGNALSRIVPGGAAASGAFQYRMLTGRGLDATTVGTGLATASLISNGTLFALPVLTLPVIVFGAPAPSGLIHAAWLGAVAFIVAFALGAVLLSTERPLEVLGTTLQRVLNRFQRRRPPTTDLPTRLVLARDAIWRDLGRSWRRALLLAFGNWGFDYLALLAALTAVGTRPRPSLVLLAYVASVVLGMIPITPGGLGFVEAGLTAMLALAGVGAGDAALATLAYRMVSYWLPLPAGAVAAVLYRRRYRGPVPGTAR